MTREEAVSFIRDTLGCRCPEEILCAISRETEENQDICWQTAAQTEPGLAADARIILAVSGRLLVVICSEIREQDLEPALRAGARLRDLLGFNRVRLAVRLRSSGPLEGSDPFPMPDGRVHLHTLPPD